MAITKINVPELFDLTTETGAIQLPVGTTAQRPAAPNTGEWRFNDDTNKVEFWDSTNWVTIDDEAICTTSTCNYPTTATALFEFESNLNDTCGGSAATSTGTTYATGKFGQALEFNGTSSYATLPNSIGIPSGPWTVSYWFNTNAITGEEPHMTTDWITANYTLMIKTVGSTLYVYGYTCAGSPAFTTQPISSTTTIGTGTWYHVALVINDVTSTSGVTLYVNGSSEATTTLSSGLCTSATNWILGDEPGSQHYDGLLDQVRFFNTALSASQVTQLYNEVGC